jgi:hypothetical protein
VIFAVMQEMFRNCGRKLAEELVVLTETLIFGGFAMPQTGFDPKFQNLMNLAHETAAAESTERERQGLQPTRMKGIDMAALRGFDPAYPDTNMDNHSVRYGFSKNAGSQYINSQGEYTEKGKTSLDRNYGNWKL